MAAAGGVPLPPGCLGHLPGLHAAWLTIAAAVSFARCANEEMKFGRQSCREQHTYVSENWNSLKSGQLPHGLLVDTVMDLKERMDTPEFSSRLSLIECILSIRLRLRFARRSAQCMTTCLQTWQPGAAFMLFQRLARRVRFLQLWWRIWRRKLRSLREQVSMRWLQLEEVMLREEIAEEELLTRKPNPLSREALLECKRVPEPDRLKFLRHELRFRRYQLLPAIRLWETEVERRNAELQRHQEQSEAMKAIGAEHDGVPIFLFPPPEPSQLPDDKDLGEMIRRARRKPENWSKIPTDRGGGFWQC